MLPEKAQFTSEESQNSLDTSSFYFIYQLSNCKSSETWSEMELHRKHI